MSKEILDMIESVSNQQGVSQDVVLEAVQAGLEMATRKKSGKEIGVRVAINEETGEYDTFQYWEVVDLLEEEIEFPDRELTVAQAKERDAELEIGDRIEQPIPSVEFGRIAAQVAKQVILQKVREAKRNLIVEDYKTRVGTLVTGSVKRNVRDGVLIEIGGEVEALLPREESIPRENFRPGDRVRAYLYEVEPQPRGPQLFLSRTRPAMLEELLKIEVPEIGEEVIMVMSVARDPGARAKIAVKTNDGRIDPIGACVGMRGSRVQAVSGELAGERVDIILWDDNPAQLVINAMAPAEVASIVMDEDSKTMDLAVSEEQLSQAIGRAGQNIRLASQLTGWTLNVMSEDELQEKSQDETVKTLNTLIEQLEVEKVVAEALVEAGISSVEEVAYVPAEELAAIEGFEEELVTELRNRAQNALLTKALSSEAGPEPAEDLIKLEGMTPDLAKTLAKNGIVTQEDLAECAVDDLLDLECVDAEKAGQLIMEARKPWFE